MHNNILDIFKKLKSYAFKNYISCFNREFKKQNP